MNFCPEAKVPRTTTSIKRPGASWETPPIVKGPPVGHAFRAVNPRGKDASLRKTGIFLSGIHCLLSLSPWRQFDFDYLWNKTIRLKTTTDYLLPFYVKRAKKVVTMYLQYWGTFQYYHNSLISLAEMHFVYDCVLDYCTN